MCVGCDTAQCFIHNIFLKICFNICLIKKIDQYSLFLLFFLLFFFFPQSGIYAFRSKYNASPIDYVLFLLLLLLFLHFDLKLFHWHMKHYSYIAGTKWLCLFCLLCTQFIYGGNPDAMLIKRYTN